MRPAAMGVTCEKRNPLWRRVFMAVNDGLCGKQCNQQRLGRQSRCTDSYYQRFGLGRQTAPSRAGAPNPAEG
jgi:hypothetical protein